MRFWTMLAHYHGQIRNASEASPSLGVSDMTMRRYLDILEGVFNIRVLQPWYVNVPKRQIKSPKIYYRDSVLLHYLLGIHSDMKIAMDDLRFDRLIVYYPGEKADYLAERIEVTPLARLADIETSY